MNSLLQSAQRMPKKTRTALWIGVGLLLLVWATRLYSLLSFPPFIDEGVHLRFGELVATSGPLARAEEGRIFTIWWFLLFQPFSQSPFEIIRLASLLTVLPGLAALLWLAKRMAGNRAALLAGALYLFSPFHLFHNRLAVPDPLANSLIMVAIYLAYRFSWRNRWVDAVAVGVVLFVAAGAKIAIIPYFVIPLVTVLTLSPTLKLNRAHMRWLAWSLGVALLLLAGFTVLLAWRGYSLFSLFTAHNHDLSRSLLQVVVNNAWDSSLRITGYLSLPLFLGCFASLVFLLWKREWFLPSIALLPLVAVWFNSRQSGRYYTLSITLMTLCLAVVLGRWVRGKAWKTQVSVLLVVVGYSFLLWWPFAQDLYTDAARLNLPTLDRAEYIMLDSSGLGLPEVYQQLKDLHAQEVIGLLSNCQGLRFLAWHDFNVICPTLNLDGSSKAALNQLISEHQGEGQYAVLEDNPYAPKTISGTWIAVVARPDGQSHLQLYMLKQTNGVK